MASAFLSQALREQATQEARGQMMKDAIARRVSSQIMGQLAQGEINADLRRAMGRGRALEQAAGQEMRRDIGKTQLEMQKAQAAQAKKMAIIGATADSVGALVSFLAETEQDEEKKKEAAPQTRVRNSSPVLTDAERASVIEDSLMYGGATGGNAISRLQAQDDALMYGGPSGQNAVSQLQAQEDSLMYGGATGAGKFVPPASPEEELVELIKKRDKDKRWMADLPPLSPKSNPRFATDEEMRSYVTGKYGSGGM